MNTRLDIYVDDAEFAEFMAELRLWRKEVRWCVQRLLQIGQKITLVSRDKTLGLGFQRESNTLFYVAKFLPEQYDDLLQQGDYLVGVNQRNVLMEDLNLKEMVSLLQNLPRPTTIHLVRLQQQCGSEGQHELRAIQKLCSDLQARRHALANRVATYELSVLEDNEIKTTLDKQKLFLDFVLRKITSLKRGIDLSKERRRMDKMKMWIEGQLQSGIPRPTLTPTTVSSATYTTRPSVVIFPTRTQPSIVPPSPKAHKAPSSSKNRDLTWLYDFASLDLKWLSQKEQKVHAILMWFEKAMEQDHSARVAKLISEQIVKALLHYWIHVRNHMADATFNTQNAFLDHARQLKHNLTANAQLRADIASERITPEALMTMSKDDLAAPERMRERLELQQTAMRSVIFRPTEANILIKTRDGFKEVAVPGIHPEVPEPSLKTPATSSSAESAGDGKSQKQPENSSTSRQPTPAAEHTPAPKPPRSTSQAPSAQPPPRPRQPNPTESSHSAQSPSVSQSQQSRHQQTSSQKRPVPSAGEYMPLKRQRSHEVVAPQEAPKQNSLKRHRSDESLESAPRNLSASKHPPEQTTSQPSQQPSLSVSNLSPEEMELEQTRGFVAAIIDNRKSVIEKMANFVYSRNNILSRAAIAPTVFAKTETINTPGKGSTIRIHIGVYTVESNIKNVSSIADIKANVMTVFEESVDSLYWRVTEILKDYAARGKRPSLILAAEDIAKKFSSQIKFDSTSRSGLHICTWRVEGVLVVKQTSTDQFLAQRLGWQGFAEFLESLLAVVQAKDAKASAPKSMTPTILHSPLARRIAVCRVLNAHYHILKDHVLIIPVMKVQENHHNPYQLPPVVITSLRSLVYIIGVENAATVKIATAPMMRKTTQPMKLLLSQMFCQVDMPDSLI
ncbi:hypothetical protein AeRB84_005165 [Aphanomyces euteiches]|nr:hypothetical protein AeRB84_006488 [Aphanomyces euteiches]KAH9152387.1 hypothetical protein AeRB84_005165 [Aphanomyces euteiches]